jgi:hypothetical protein
MKHGVSLLALAVTLAISPVAKADSTFNDVFNFIDGTSATMNVTGSYSATDGGYDLTSGSITIDCSVSAVGCVSDTVTLGSGSVASPGFFGADNVLYSSNPIVDSWGVSFDDATADINLSSNNNDYVLIEDTASTGYTAATPEPSSWLLLASGIVGFAFFMYRKHGAAAFLNI